jgi:hypothetical protein
MCEMCEMCSAALLCAGRQLFWREVDGRGCFGGGLHTVMAWRCWGGLSPGHLACHKESWLGCERACLLACAVLPAPVCCRQC